MGELSLGVGPTEKLPGSTLCSVYLENIHGGEANTRTAIGVSLRSPNALNMLACEVSFARPWK